MPLQYAKKLRHVTCTGKGRWTQQQFSRFERLRPEIYYEYEEYDYEELRICPESYWTDEYKDLSDDEYISSPDTRWVHVSRTAA